MFIEVVMRALTRVHSNYQMWTMDQKWKDPIDYKSLNTGSGIEHAGETTVCDAITQEFMYCRLGSGSRVVSNPEEGVEDGLRFHSIDREVPYAVLGIENKWIADIVLERIDPASDQRVNRFTFIEAKRASLCKKHLTGDSPDASGLQTSLIIADIDALIETRSAKSDDLKPFAHLLIWGVCGSNELGCSMVVEAVQNLYRKRHGIEAPIDLALERRIPIDWEGYDPREQTTMAIKKVLWAALIEVNLDLGQLPQSAKYERLATLRAKLTGS